MKHLPNKLQKKLEERKTSDAFRKLGQSNKLIDFSSNDYLGFSKSEAVFENAHNYLVSNSTTQNGSTGSRLLSGNHALYDNLEKEISKFHHSDAALIFNSGYNANVGLLSSVPQRGDIILYDELVHASIRDGIGMSNAKSYKFKHNDLKDLEVMLKRFQKECDELYVISESVFSMDGDTPDIKTLTQVCKTHNAHLIIDEAHAIGVFGQGLVEETIFAKIITFGKAMGCHGAAVLGSQNLKDYLTNFSRPFIYTTALTPHTLATIKCAYNELAKTNQINHLKENIDFFVNEIERLKLDDMFIKSNSAIHCCIISGNKNVKAVAKQLQNKGYEIKPILSPTVPNGEERLRFCLHSYNSQQEISNVLDHLATFVKK